MSSQGLRSRWAAGETAFGGWCCLGSAFSAELLGSLGFDYVCVDCQHGLTGYDAMWPMVQALRGTGATPVVRAPANDGPWLGKALDAGAEAVIVPMVNSAEEALRAAAACRYAPEGVRSYGPVRAGLLLGDDAAAVNRAVTCLVMIETVAAVAVADAICATPGSTASTSAPPTLRSA